MKNLKNTFYIYVGTMLEHLDSMLFALYLPVLASYFFEKQNPTTTWVLGFLSFSLYFVVRPLGAIVLGMIGDKYGRKVALLISIVMMSFATLFLGICSSFDEMGPLASILFLILRIIQGLSVGGEYSSAMTYTFEIIPAKNINFYCALLIASVHLGGTFASLFAYLNPESFRFVFIIAGMMGLLSLQGRVMLLENFSPKKKNFSIKHYFNKQAIPSYLRVMASSACLIFIFYTVMVYFNKILSQKYGLSLKTTFSINILLHLIWVIITPMVGCFMDKYRVNYLKTMRFGSLSTMMIAIPMLLIAVSQQSILLLVLAQIALMLSHVLFCCPTPQFICNFFKESVRNGHVSFSYALGISITAALMPFINDFMYKLLGIYGVAVAIFLFAILGLASTFDKFNVLFFKFRKNFSIKEFSYDKT